ncbi:MAG: glycosyltransferase [Myxococcales bacterium]|nr:glycosyltransferase [Myxococcales bacterium]
MSGVLELSLVIPAFDEGERLVKTLEQVLAWVGDRPYEVIVADDGSTDDTEAVLARFADRGVRSVRLAQNSGKGAAVAAGVRAARGDIVAFFDADLAYSLDQLDALLAPVREGADLAVGARDLHPLGLGPYGPVRKLATMVFSGLVGTALGLVARDTQCGFKAFRADVARALFAAVSVTGFGFDAELLFLAQRWGLRVVRVPVFMHSHGASKVRVVRDALRMAADVARIRGRALRGAYPASFPR